MNKLSAKLSACLLSPLFLFSQSSVRVDSFYALSLGRVKSVSVILPAHYNPRTRYPVLFLLHGLGGNYTDWSARTKLLDYTDAHPLVIVMPDGEDSWYVNSSMTPGDKFEDYIINDVSRFVSQRYSIDTTRQAIAGLSMGGYGAAMLALRHPSKFLFAGALSGAITVPAAFSDTTLPPEKFLAPSLRKAFGNMSHTELQRRDVFQLYKKVPKHRLPYLYLAIGIQDGFQKWIPAHHALVESLRVYGAAYEYHETQGSHNWEFWDREIQPLLGRLRKIMKF